MVYLITADSFALHIRDGALGVCLSLPSNTTNSVYCPPHQGFKQSYGRKPECIISSQPGAQDKMTSAMYITLFLDRNFKVLIIFWVRIKSFGLPQTLEGQKSRQRAE